MATRPRLAAASRTVTGKKVARLRHDGLLPAVVYGHGTSSENVSVIAHDFELLRRHVGASTLVDLSVDGGKARPVLVSAIQVSPSATCGTSSIAPTTTATESGRISDQPRPLKRSSQAGMPAPGSATSAAWVEMSTPSATRNGVFTPPP